MADILGIVTDPLIEMGKDKWREHKAAGQLQALQDHYAAQKDAFRDLTQNNEIFQSAPAELKMEQMARLAGDQALETQRKLDELKEADAKAFALIQEERAKLEAQQKEENQRLAEAAKEEARKEEALKEAQQQREAELKVEQQKQQDEMTQSLQKQGRDQGQIEELQDRQQQVFQKQMQEQRDREWQQHREEAARAYAEALREQSTREQAMSAFQR